MYFNVCMLTHEINVIIVEYKQQGVNMKSRVPAIILAIGISAAPVFAKNTSRRADNKDSSKIEERKHAQKRADNSYKRIKQIELEKEFIKETENEILNVLSTPIEQLHESTAPVKVEKVDSKVVVSEPVPANGIDITDAFIKIKLKSESS